MNRRIAVIGLVCLLSFALVGVSPVLADDRLNPGPENLDQGRSPASSNRHLVPDRWWESLAGMKIVTLKKGRRYAHEIDIDPERASAQLDEIKAEGFRSIEIFAPAHGLYGYNGLDTVNHYVIDPELGTMDDFRQFVRIAHSKGISVVAFINVGYFSLEAPDWLEACDDPDGEKGKWFIWADSPDAPIPPENIYFNWPRGPESPEKTWGWQYSERAGRYFWAKWQTKDEDGNWVGLPQNDWGYEGWAKEAGNIVRFWMDTGLDGLIIDAPIYYIGLTWEKNNRYMTDIIESYGNTFRQPEGSERVGWVAEGNYNCMQDYGLGEGREEVIRRAIETGDPRGIERALRDSHDIIQANGGVLYRVSRKFEDPVKTRLYCATVAAIGDIVVYNRRGGSPDAEETWILNTKQTHPALHAVSSRRKLPTDADDKCYAILRTAQDGSERVMAVFNYQETPQTFSVNVSGVNAGQFVDLRTFESIAYADTIEVSLPAYGYRFYQVVTGD